MLGGVIFGETMRAAIRCSSDVVFVHARRDLFKRLLIRGYTVACFRTLRWFCYPVLP
jgi:hypothetical protein